MMKHVSKTGILLRGVRLKCPACGRGRLFESLFRMRERCEKCHIRFAREQGYFIGAIYVNVIATESLIFGTYLLMALLVPLASSAIYRVLFALAITLPLLFNCHAKSLWLCFDFMMDPPEDVA